MSCDGGGQDQGVADWVGRLKRAAELGELLDLAPNTPDEQVSPGDSATWPADRIIPASALRAVLTDPNLQVNPHGLQIRAARFDEHLDLENVYFPHRLHLTCCYLAAGLNADSATFRQLEMEYTHVIGEVRALATNIAGDFALTKAELSNPDGYALFLDMAEIGGNLGIVELCAWGEVRGISVNIGGHLLAGNAQLVSNPGGVALGLDGAKVSGGLYAADLHTWGGIRASGASIGADIDLTNARLTHSDGIALNLSQAKVSRNLHAEELHTWGEVSAVGVRVDGQINLTNAVLTKPNGWALVLDAANIGGGLVAAALEAAGEFRAPGALIARQLVLNKAQLSNPGGVALELTRAQVSGGLFARELHTTGELCAPGASVNDQLDLTKAKLVNAGAGCALNLAGAQISGGFTAVELMATGEVRASRAVIDSFLNLTKAELHNPDGIALNLEAAVVAQLFLLRSTCEGLLNLTMSRITALTTDEATPRPVVAAGWEVGDVHGPLRSHWEKAHQWLKPGRSAGLDDDAGKAVTVQPWRALAAVYERNGDPASAKRLRVAAAKQVTKQAPRRTKALRWIYYLVAGNGYYPLLALIWMLVLLGLAVSVVAVNREDIVPTNPAAAKTAVEQHFGIGPTTIASQQSDKQEQADQFLPVTAETPCEVHPGYPCMNSFVFAVNAVMPPAASTNRNWDVAEDATLALTALLPILKLLSWALAAVLLAGLTGLLRKD